MAKIDLSNISHSYNPNDPNPVYALNGKEEFIVHVVFQAEEKQSFL